MAAPKLPKSISAVDLCAAADWLMCYEGEPDSIDETRTAIEAIAAWLDALAQARILDEAITQVAKEAGLSKSAMRKHAEAISARIAARLERKPQ
jgi:hypothetical protein